MGSGIGRALAKSVTGMLDGQNRGEAELRRRGIEDQELADKREIQRMAIMDALTTREQKAAEAQREAAEAPLRQQLLQAQIGQTERANQPKVAETVAPEWQKLGYPDFKSWRDDRIAQMSDRRPTWQKEGYSSFEDWRADKAKGSGGSGTVTEGERLAASMLPRLDNAEQVLEQAPQPNLVQQWMAKVPWGIGNAIASPDYQQYDNAAGQFVTGVLRPESKAQISDKEIQDGYRRYAPLPGDSPELRAQKRRNRELAKQQTRIMAGRAAEPAGPVTAPTPAPPEYKARYKENPF